MINFLYTSICIFIVGLFTFMWYMILKKIWIDIENRKLIPQKVIIVVKYIGKDGFIQTYEVGKICKTDEEINEQIKVSRVKLKNFKRLLNGDKKSFVVPFDSLLVRREDLLSARIEQSRILC